ncbi:hypothetical protein NLI96_g6880 [Meripilus lineatus]|uniref:Protein kinase domain-containing protein n=1 Tax=Meripilus lineatus TaxID=2056292 RepID=A0AAD5V2G0_9APHY|nr:hypothetical protein NLI96_g6880 [Physisporinus lineatus]
MSSLAFFGASPGTELYPRYLQMGYDFALPFPDNCDAQPPPHSILRIPSSSAREEEKPVVFASAPPSRLRKPGIDVSSMGYPSGASKVSGEIHGSTRGRPQAALPQLILPGLPPRPQHPLPPQHGRGYESIPPSISHVFPPVLMRGPIVEHSISLVKAAIITGDTSGIIGLSNEKMQCVVDVIHELCFASGIVPQALILKGFVISNVDSIGGGGFADIYQGTYRQVPVALKRLRVFQTLEESKRLSLRKAFYQEALIWHQLDHPHVLNLLGVGEDASGRMPYMVLPWIEYGNVRQLLDQKIKETQFHGTLFLTTITRWLLEIAQGLSYLHSEGVVHGDLRGVNILVDRSGKMKLADFGLAVIAEAGQSLSVTIRGGAFGWLAPELIDPESFGFVDARPTFASDIYSFACVCIEVRSTLDPRLR